MVKISRKSALFIFCFALVSIVGALLSLNKASVSFTNCSNSGVNYCMCEDALTGDVIYRKSMCQEEGCGILLYDSEGKFIEATRKTDCDIEPSNFNCGLSYEILTINCQEISEKYFNGQVN